MQYRIIEPKLTQCQECGSEIEYGRVDKKFCCSDCKNKYYNRIAKDNRAAKRRILSAIARNYDVLTQCIKCGVKSIDIVDAVAMGFVPGIVTSHHKRGNRDEYGCLDIKFNVSNSRLGGITKIENLSLSLQDEKENNSKEKWKNN